MPTEYENAAREFMKRWPNGSAGTRALLTEIDVLRAEVERLQAIESRAIDALRGNASETDEYERGWLDACTEILGKRP